MPWVGLELTILVLQRAKAVHALDRAATATGSIVTSAFTNYGMKCRGNLRNLGPIVIC
jgi:hypothetical protein